MSQSGRSGRGRGERGRDGGGENRGGGRGGGGEYRGGGGEYRGGRGGGGEYRGGRGGGGEYHGGRGGGGEYRGGRGGGGEYRGGRGGDFSGRGRGGGDRGRGYSGSSQPAAQDYQKSEIQQLAEEIRRSLILRRGGRITQFTKRPDFCTAGQLVEIMANHFLMKFRDMTIFQYDVEIEAAPRPLAMKEVVPVEGPGDHVRRFRKMRYAICRKVIEKIAETNSGRGGAFDGINPVYDGQKILYSNRKLGGEVHAERGQRFEVDIDEGGRVSKFYATIKYAAPIELARISAYYKKTSSEMPQDAIQALDIIIRYGPSLTRIQIGASLYSPREDRREDIGGCRQVAFGHYQSARPVMAGTTLVVAKSATAFYKSGPIVNFFEAILKDKRELQSDRNLRSTPRLSDWAVEILNKDLRTMEVETGHLGYVRKYRINKVSRKSAKEHKFQWVERKGDGQPEINLGSVSVEEYFLKKYRRKLELPHMPCLLVGNPSNPIALPIEVCQLVANQHVRRKLEGEQTSQMIRKTVQPPSQMMRDVERTVREIKGEGQTYLREFGIEISDRPMRLNARVLEPPSIVVGRGQQVRIMDDKRGQWDLRNNPFYQQAQLDNWILVNLVQREVTDEILGRFSDDLINKAAQRGMGRFPPLVRPKLDPRKPGAVRKVFEKVKNDYKKAKLIMFVIERDDDVYNEIKLIGDTEDKIVTQCVLYTNIKKLDRRSGEEKCDDATLSNILMKINAKLGGINSISPQISNFFRNKNIMVVGADVTHPAPADKISVSVAACVASTDVDCCKYSVSVRVQKKSREEIIRGLDEMMAEVLKAYQDKRKTLPEIIIFYRDGVSEGQFAKVLQDEIGLLLKCFTKYPNYRPKITFVVVQKRHHTRFVPFAGEGCGRHNNIQPGTLVDTAVTHVEDYDYYLCSHAGIQGTSRPTHYYVLQDDNNFASNDLYNLTYYLCHVYNKCTRSISIPAPVAYGHLAAYRTRIWIIGKNLGSDSQSVLSGATLDDELDEVRVREINQTIQVSEEMRTWMFYC